MTKRGAGRNTSKVLGVVILLCSGLGLTVLEGTADHGPSGSVDKKASARPTAPSTGRWVEAYGKLPLSFEENQGQTAREVRYLSHGRGFELFLTPQEAVLALSTRKHLDFSPAHRVATIRALRNANRAAPPPQMTAVRLQLEGANPSPQISGVDHLPARVNYFVGNDPMNWHTDVPSYARVKYAEVYPGVDLVFYGNQRQLEYDFIVAPGADPKNIAFKVTGTRKMRVNARGNLELKVRDGELELQKPIVYQVVEGVRHEIAGQYVIRRDHRVAFQVAAYDRRAALILDPVLIYATYLGGTATEDFTPAAAIAIDSAGDAFLAGQTTSVNFPAGAKGGVVTTPNPNSGASFVAELDPTGANLLYSTYLAGSTTNAGDSAFGIALDSTGKVYVTGQTFATNFPTTPNAFNAGPVSATTATAGTVYLTKLDPTVTGAGALLYSTYVSGTGGEFANGVAVDAAGNAYIAGNTSSTDFPTPATAHPLQSTPSNASTAFVSRIDTTVSGTTSLIFSTYFGGNGANAAATGGLGYGDQILGIAVDSSQNAYVAGATSSTDAPATFITSATAFQTAPPAGNTEGSAFVSKIATTAGTLSYSTYLAGSGGGTTGDQAFAMALGPGNVTYVTGKAGSSNFPTTAATAFDTTNSTAGKAFITLLDATMSGANSLRYSTLLGGSSGDFGNGITTDASGIAYLVGTTASADFAQPKTNLDAFGAMQTKLLNTNGNAFIAKLNPTVAGVNGLLYATYYGGSGDGTHADEGFGIAVDSATPPHAYITGETFSTDLPVVSAFQSKLNGNGNPAAGNSDAFAAKLALIPTLTVMPSPFDFGTQLVHVASGPQAFTVTNNTASAATFTSIVVTGVSPAANTDFKVSTDACSPSVAAAAPCTVSVTFTPSVSAAESATLVISATVTNGGQSSTEVLNVNLSGTGSNTPPDFTLSAAPATLTVASGMVGSAVTITVNPTGGFASAVALTCTGAPTNSTCVLTPTSITAPTTSSLTFTAHAMLVPLPRSRPPLMPLSPLGIVSLFVTLMLALWMRSAKRFRTRLVTASAILICVTLGACSGVQAPNTNTKKGVYPLTVTGTSGSLSHTTTVTITVD